MAGKKERKIFELLMIQDHIGTVSTYEKIPFSSPVINLNLGK